jgi:hypothetical protein
MSKAKFVWADGKIIAEISEQAKDVYNHQIKSILCQGARTGKEVRLFKKCFPKANVIGTDILPAGRGVIPWDFHDIKYSWLGKFDIVYSNSWDHLYDADFGLLWWSRYLRENGLLILETSNCHTDSGVSETDPFGLNHDEIEKHVSMIVADTCKYLFSLDFDDKKNLNKKVYIWQKY